MSESFEEIADQIYWNEYLMRRIIGYCGLTVRKNLEECSHRMLNLSRSVPVEMNYVEILMIEDLTITIGKKNFKVLEEDLANIVKVVGCRFGNVVQEVIGQFPLTRELLISLSENFPRLRKISLTANVSGQIDDISEFSEFLCSIDELEIGDYDVAEGCLEGTLQLLVYPKKLTILLWEWENWDEASIKKLKKVVSSRPVLPQVISVDDSEKRDDNTTIVELFDLSQFTSCFVVKTRLLPAISIQFSKIQNFKQLDFNLVDSELEDDIWQTIWYEHMRGIETLEHFSLLFAEYNEVMMIPMRHVLQNSCPSLKSIYFEDLLKDKGSPNPIFSIAPLSLTKLCLRNVEMQDNDLKKLPIYLPELRDFTFEYALGEHRYTSIQSLIDTLSNLKKLERFKTSEIFTINTASVFYNREIFPYLDSIKFGIDFRFHQVTRQFKLFFNTVINDELDKLHRHWWTLTVSHRKSMSPAQLESAYRKAKEIIN